MGIALPCATRFRQQVVLVVDDEPLIRALVSDWLFESGVATAEAADGHDAIAYLASNPEVALVFSDINMPGACDGVALAAWIRSNRPDVSVILASAQSSHEGFLPGVRFFAKPYDLKDVVHCITAELQRNNKLSAAQTLNTA